MSVTDVGYGIRTARSREIVERLERSIPGGNTRSLAYFPPYPLVISSGSGCRIRDADGNEFIDLLNNYTASVHGHAVPAVNEAMRDQATLGTAFPAPGELQAELAERIVGRVASVEKVRFANSGTEAVMMAVRAARAFTGREKIVKAQGGYDGMWEQVPVSWDQDPYRAAMPEGVRDLLRMVDYNDVDQLEAAMEAEGEEVAAILLEPVTGTGVLTGKPNYFAAARRLADEHGALLICDEVITLRLSTGGYQEVLGVRPDLTTMGKIIGGGLPVGAYGGRRDLMEQIAPAGPVYQAGTLSGNPLAMTAGLAVLRRLRDRAVYERLEEAAGRLCAGLSEAAREAGVETVTNRVGSMFTTFFTDSEVTDWPTAAKSDRERYGKFFHAMLEGGVYLAPSQFEAAFVGTAHTDELLDRTVEAARKAFRSVRSGT